MSDYGTPADEVIRRLAEVAGHLFDQPELLAEWSRDWWPYAAKLLLDEDDLPLVAVVPDSTEDVAAAVRIAAVARRPIIVRGGGSNLAGALQPRPGAILLNLSGLNVIDPVDPRDLTVRVDAGVFGGELEERLDEQGFSLMHEPRSLHLSTVGGWIATGATGLTSTKYGGIDAQIEALEVVLADGTTAHLNARDATSRLLRLVVGSGGAYGIVTSATLRVRPTPPVFRLAALANRSFDHALDSIRQLLQRGITPAVVALYDRRQSRVLHAPLAHTDDHLVIIGFEGAPEIVALEERLTIEALSAGGARLLEPEVAWQWWEERHSASWLIEGNGRPGQIADAIVVTASWTALPGVISRVREAIEPLVDDSWHHIELFSASGATVAFPIFVREASDDRAMEVYRAAWRMAVKSAAAAGGWIAGRTPAGEARRPWLHGEAGDEANLPAALKRTFDPENRFISGEATGPWLWRDRE